MTKKNYIRIAKAINEQRQIALNIKQDQKEIGEARLHGIASVMYHLAEYFREDNPRFNQEKFIDACYKETL